MIPWSARRRTAELACLAMIACAALAWRADASAQPAPGLEPPAPIASANFETTPLGSVPQGFSTAGGPAYVAEVVRDDDGGHSLKFERKGAGDTGYFFGSTSAVPVRGRSVALHARVRSSPGTQAALWLRIDREDQKGSELRNTSDTPITRTSWGEYEMSMEAPADGSRIVFGVMFWGAGPVWINSLELVDSGKVETRGPVAAPLGERGRDNLVAFTRLVGVLRDFSPTTESRGLDWDTYTIDAVNAVEPCKDADELIATLKAWTLPIAPGVEFWRGRRDQGPAESARPDNATGAVAMVHYGFSDPGLDPSKRRMNVYSSELVRIDVNAEATDSRPAPGEAVTISLGGDVFARVVIAPYVENGRTLPEATSERPRAASDRSKGWRATPAERAVRFAVLIEAWNTLNHFYPYFDVTDTDWVAALPPALEKAATDATPEDFWRTLAMMHAKIKDGHGWTGGPGQFSVMPHPYSSEWVGDDIVIRRVADAVADRLSPGDVIDAIDGTSVRDLYAAVEPTIGAASEQWKRHRALSQIGWGPGKGDVTLSIKRGTSSLEVAIPRAGYTEPTMQRPDDGSELSPGIVYFNLDGTGLAALSENLPKLASARGIVFDLRGYPSDAGSAVLPYLTDTNIKSAQWRVPIIARPNYQRVRFKVSNWNLPPRQPRLTKNVAFLTDGRAISYAESCMGIVEAYKLGEIVGSATAGSNGNVTSVELPAGYSISWTGMQVLKHDGSRHHGVGIAPTVPVAPTREGLAAGRDEVLEKAVEVVKAKLGT